MTVLSNIFFYLILLLFLIILGGILKGSRQGRNVFLVLSFLTLLFFFTVRDIKVGWDTIPYVDTYSSIFSFDTFDSYLEPGWILFNKLMYSISPSPNMLFFGTGLLGIGCFFFAIRRISVDPVMSVWLYVMFALWFNLMNQVRNQIAVSICMISFYFLYKKKYIASISITALAFCIHDSALVFLIFILAVYIFKELNRRAYVIIFSSVIVIFLLYDVLIKIVAAYYYTSYFEEARLIQHTKGGNLKIFIIVLLLFLIIQRANIYYIHYKNKKNKEPHGLQFDSRLDRMLQMAIIFCLCIQLISINNTMIGRFGNYFFTFLTVIIPNTIHKLPNNNDRALYSLILGLTAFIYMIISLAFSENGYGRDGVIPYVMKINF